MKNIINVFLILIAVFFVVPSYGAETIQMLNDSIPAYSLKILEDGFAGYKAGTVLASFCVEKDEYFEPGSKYYAVVNTEADNGGVGGCPDPIDERTAYLYTQFVSGNPDFQDALKLQDAIWYIEQESCKSNSYVGLADLAVSSGAWSGLGDVRVLNLYQYQYRHRHCYGYGFGQDQLIIINTVPAPGALILAGMGTLLVGWLRRRKDQI